MPYQHLGLMDRLNDPTELSWLLWEQYLPDVQLGINTTIHDITKKSPSKLLFRRRVTNPSQGILNEVISDTGDGLVQGSLEDVRADASYLMQKQNEVSKKQYNSRKKPAQQYKEGYYIIYYVLYSLYY